jgi:hypothetical protein
VGKAREVAEAAGGFWGLSITPQEKTILMKWKGVQLKAER